MNKLCGADWAALRYLAVDYLRANEDAFGLCKTSFDKLNELNAFSAEKLYLNDFNGFWFDDGKRKLNAVAFSGNDCLIGEVIEYDEEGEEIALDWYLL